MVSRRPKAGLEGPHCALWPPGTKTDNKRGRIAHSSEALGGKTGVLDLTIYLVTRPFDDSTIMSVLRSTALDRGPPSSSFEFINYP